MSIQNLKSRRWPFTLIFWLLLIIQVDFYFKGLFMTKKELTNKSEVPAGWNETEPPKKVIMMLVDALREDFVEFERDTKSEFNKLKMKHYLDYSESVYKGQKIELFANLLLDEPQNTILLPMESEMPTVTTARIKSILTGGLSSFFEIKEDFAHDLIPEDNVLHQIKNFANATGQHKEVVFTGDHIWLDMVGFYFDKEQHYPSFNIRDLDTNDRNVHRDLLRILKEPGVNNTRNFDLLVCHLLGIDHAGHTFNANHSEIERKVVETEAIIQDVIEAMDQDTVLLLYGDHGMTNDGNHGGGT